MKQYFKAKVFGLLHGGLGGGFARVPGDGLAVLEASLFVGRPVESRHQAEHSELITRFRV